ncbi:MAG: hypothetical protein Q8P24_16450 [Desulfobacterales bacterium]|nr:hypothetical protein [Desulfobacterales bacterium]
MSNIFDDADVVYQYSRMQALEDGVLVDITDPAKEAGFKFPVAVTQGVYGVLNDTSTPCQDFEGRVWDMLMVFRMHIRTCEGDTVNFAPLFASKGKAKPEPVSMWAKIGPGDDGAPVMTVMLEGED